MIDLTLDMEQYDCPFIDTTDEHAVSFSAVYWEFDEANHRLDTRMLVEGADREELDSGLDSLRDHRRMCECTLLSKQEEVAHVYTTIEETSAMETIRGNGGYITGPFHIADGSELWHVGFDRQSLADQALASLEVDNDFEVVDRESTDLAELTGFVQNVDAATTLIEACRALSSRERETLKAAVAEGYFESPRRATLGTLADEFDISKPAVSKTLRRSQRKVMERVVEAAEDLE